MSALPFPVNLKQRAVSYAGVRDWGIVPIYGIDPKTLQCSCCVGGVACKTPGKRPRITEWQRNWSKDSEQINRWWDAMPNSNIGIVTGAASNLYVVDIDPKNGGIEAWDKIVAQYGDVDTLTVKTGSGGYHYYFQHPGGIHKNTASAIAPGVDTRGDGGQVVAPGSLHASGNRYEFVDPSVPVAVMPEWLITLVEKAEHAKKAEKQAARSGADGSGIIADGKRSDTLISYAGSMRNDGMTPDEINGALQVINRHRCQPPLTDDEVRAIADSAGRYEPKHDIAAQDIGSNEAEKMLRARMRTSDIFEAFNALLPPDLCPPSVATTLRILVGKARGLADGQELFFTDYEAGLWLPGDPDVDDDSVARRWKRAITEAEEWQRGNGERWFRRTPGTNRVIGSTTKKASTYEVPVLDAIIEVHRIANRTKRLEPDIFEGLKKKDLKRSKRFALAAASVRQNLLADPEPDPEKVKVPQGSRSTPLVGRDSRAMDRLVKAFAQMVDLKAEMGDGEVATLIERTKDRLATIVAEKGFEHLVELFVDPALRDDDTEEADGFGEVVSTHGNTEDWTEDSPEGGGQGQVSETARYLTSENDNSQENKDLPARVVDRIVQLPRPVKPLQLPDEVYIPAYVPNDSEALSTWLGERRWAASDDEAIEAMEREAIQLEASGRPLEMAAPVAALR